MKTTLSGTVLILAALAATGCGSGSSGTDAMAATDEGAEASGQDTGSAGDASQPQCFQCIKKNMLFRWDKIKLVEPSIPEGLPQFLNNILQPDVDGYRINIGLRLDEVKPRQDGDIDVKLTSGAMWHDLDESEVLEIHGGDKKPAWYGFLDEYATEVDAIIKKDCGFGTLDPILVNFKSGPPEHGFMCSPAHPDQGIPRDMLPFQDSMTWGHFTDDCKRIVDARIDSCIRADRACEICVFILSPDYTTYFAHEDPSVDPADPCTADFCKRWCGTSGAGIPMWTNLGAFIEGIGVQENCEVDGHPGYRFSVEFEAEVVEQKP